MCTNCQQCHHFTSSDWSALDAAGMKELDAGRHAWRYLPGEPVYHEGDEPTGIHCVSSGLVGIRKTDAEGESVLLRLVRPGESFGYRSLLTNMPHGVSAEALKETRICLVPAAAVRRLADRDPALMTNFFRRLARDMAEAETKVLETVTASCRTRFLRLLAAFAGPEAGSLELPVSRQDIASLIGVRSETMSRVIRAVEEDGLARFKGRHVDIPDRARLTRECLGDGTV